MGLGRVEGQCRKEEGEESRMSLRVWPEQLEEENHHLLRLGEMLKLSDLWGRSGVHL